MKLSQAKEYLHLIQAAAEGKTIQWKYKDETGPWSDCETDSPFEPYESEHEFRIKPEPELRPWRPEEVPVGALIKTKGSPFRHLIVSFDEETCKGFAGQTFAFTPISALGQCEHSTDHGKTWQPCGVQE